MVHAETVAPAVAPAKLARFDTSWTDVVDPNVVFGIITKGIPGLIETTRSEFFEDWHDKEQISWVLDSNPRSVVGFSRENMFLVNGGMRYVPCMRLVARNGDDFALESKLEDVNVQLRLMLENLMK